MIARSVLVGLVFLCGTASAPLACQSKTTPLLDDRFKTADPGWGQPDNIADFTQNGLILRPLVGGSAWRWNRNFQMGHADLCVDVTSPAKLPIPADEETLGAVGLWFWGKDSQNFYTATIALDGTIQIDRLVNGQWQAVFAPAPSSAVKTNPGAVNEIEIVTNGNTASFFVNGKQIQDLQGDPPPDGGPPGVYGESGSTQARWTFSRVRLF